MSKKVGVIGGGPAGMQAARTLSQRGHRVVLFEKEADLGGLLKIAHTAPFKGDVKDYLNWAVRMTEAEENVTVYRSTEATLERVEEEAFDALIVATGAVPFAPPIPGVELPHVVWGGDVEAGRAEVGNDVIVAGGGQTGCEIALHLAQQGKSVTLVEMLPLDEMIANAPRINMHAVLGMLREYGVALRNVTRLEAIGNGSVRVRAEDREEEFACDTVVLCLGMRPDREAAEPFRHLAPDLYLVGDSTTSKGNVWTATASGFDAAMNI